MSSLTRGKILISQTILFTDEGVETSRGLGTAQSHPARRQFQAQGPVAAVAGCVWGFEFTNYCFPIGSLLIIDAEAENT